MIPTKKKVQLPLINKADTKCTYKTSRWIERTFKLQFWMQEKINYKISNRKINIIFNRKEVPAKWSMINSYS